MAGLPLPGPFNRSSERPKREKTGKNHIRTALEMKHD